MFYIGNHVSSSNGFEAMGRKTTELGGNTFAFFTRNPRGGKAKELDFDDISRLVAWMKEHEFGKIVAHAPYTMNLCATKEDIRTFSKNMFFDDLQRMEYLPGNFYNFHLGSHVGQGAEVGIRLIADAINETLWKECQTTILLETMAGKGSEIGGTFEEIRKIIDLIELKDKVGVCLDTCHVWDGGYDIVHNLDGVLDEFDRVIGLNRLCAIHLNDSMNILAAHKDRHQKLGEGNLGVEAIKRIVTHPALQGKPFILETPNEDAGYAKEIALVKEWVKLK